MDSLMDLQVKILKLQNLRKELMKKKMKEKGCSQKWLADRIGVKASKLNAWLNHTVELSEREITKINNVFSE